MRRNLAYMWIMIWWQKYRMRIIITLSLAILAIIGYYLASLYLILRVDSPPVVDPIEETRALPSPGSLLRLCQYEPNEIASIVWSHRAFKSRDDVDGSRATLQYLLNNGVRNFDVDVSCLEDPSTKQCIYVIAHPTHLYKFSTSDVKLHRNNSPQTVEDFLLQIYMYCQLKRVFHAAAGANRFYPLVTLEMKFREIHRELDLIHLVQNSPMAKHVALIFTDPHKLSLILPYIGKGGVAAAYRSRPLSDRDYTWPKTIGTAAGSSSSSSSSSSRSSAEQSLNNDQPLEFTSVPSDLVLQSSAADSGTETLGFSRIPPHLAQLSQTKALFNTTGMGWVSSVNFTTQSIITTGSVPRNFLQVYMPDIKLLTHPLAWDGQEQTNQDHPIRKQRHRSKFQLVLGWVVDTEEELWVALEKGVDGVISNNPVRLRHAVQNAYNTHCEVAQRYQQEQQQRQDSTQHIYSSKKKYRYRSTSGGGNGSGL
mmetsp:Transcript_9505/g.15773  ORF Transcript_9505/g.15773 Transcript_9505/m.15773 type:complete len:480 (+) Transcript_9505:41-1480(+)